MVRATRTAVVVLGLALLVSLPIGFAATDGDASVDAICGGTATKTWVGGSGNSWHTAANWSPAGVPGAADLVCIDAAGAAVTYTTGATSILALESDETLTVSAGTLNLTSTTDASSLGTLHLSGSGTLGGAAAITVGTLLDWTGGTLSGSGSPTLTVPSGAALQMSSSGGKNLSGRDFQLDSTTPVDWTGAGNLVLTSAGFAIGTAATLSIDGDQDIVIGSGTTQLTNLGTLEKTSGTGDTVISVPFTNSGSVDVDTGSIVLQSSGTHTGSFAGSGHLRLTVGSISLAGAVSVATLDATSGTNTVTGSLTSPTVNVSGGTLNLNTPTTLSTLNLSGSGVVGGTAAITIGTLLDWTGGTLGGTGSPTLTVPAGAALQMSSSAGKNLNGRSLELDSTTPVDWTDAGNLVLTSASFTIGASATLSINGDQDIVVGSGTNAVTNLGTLQKISGTGDTVISVPFTNSGSVDVAAGTLVLQSNGTHTGTFSGGGRLRLSVGTISLAGAVSVATLDVIGGASTVTGPLTSPTVNVTGGTLNLNTPTTFSTLSLSGSGVVGGTAAITIGTLFDWTGGTLSGTGSPTLSVPAGAALQMSGGSGKNLTARSFQLDTATPTVWTGTGNLVLTSATFTIGAAATLSIDGDQDVVTGSGTNQLTNLGMLAKSNGTGDTLITVPFDNSGTVNVAAGSLVLQNSGTHTGSFGGIGHVRLSVGTIALAGAVSVATLDVIGGTGTVTGPLTSPAVNVTGGTLNLNTPTTLSTLNLGGSGTLGGTAAVTIGTLLDWTGGTLAGSGSPTLTVPSGAALQMSGAAGKLLNGRVLQLDTPTPCVWTGSGLTMTSATFMIGAAATLSIDGDQDLTLSSGTNQLTNLGALQKISGTGDSVISVPFTNSGVVRAQSGTTSVTGTFTNYNTSTDVLTGGTYEASATLRFMGADVVTNAAAIVLDGAAAQILDTSNVNGLRNFATNASSGAFTVRNGKNVTVPGSFSNAGTLTAGSGSTFAVTNDAFANSGTLRGAGTVDANVTSSSGTVAPGGSPGILTVIGNYTQGSAGTLQAEIAGPAAGTGYDRLAVTGTAAIDGLLAITTDNAYTPPEGSTYQVVTGTLTGQFEILSGDQISGSFVYLDEYHAGDVTLHATTLTGGCTKLWDGGGASTSWHANRNWSPNGIPRTTSDACILDQPGSVTITHTTGTTQVQSLYSEEQVALTGGTLELTSTARDSTVTGLTVSGASTVLTGAARLVLSGASAWTGGTMTGTGTTRVSAGSSLTLSGGTKTLSGGRAIDNKGTVTWAAGGISHGGGTTITNASGSLFDITSDAATSFDQGGTRLLVHTLAGGTLRKSAGTGTSTLDVDLQNDGVLEAQSGTLLVSGSLLNFNVATLTGGTYDIGSTFRFAGANIVTNAATVVLDGPGSAIQDGSGANALAGFSTNAGSFTAENGGNVTVPGSFTNSGVLTAGSGTTFAVTNNSFASSGTLQGAGTIDANVTSSGTLAPGLSPGILTVDGNYTQAAAGQLRVELTGTTPGSQYDRLVVTGVATLGGTLTIVTGYTPTTGSDFEIETGPGTRVGQFATIEGRYLPDGRLYQSVYGPANVRLIVNPRTRPTHLRPASRP